MKDGVFDGLKIELKKALQDIMQEETKSWLIRTLLRSKTATWDIYYFAKNQAGLRTVHKNLDWQTMSAALRAKLRDILSTLTHYRRIKSKLECNIREYDCENKKFLKQLLAPWKREIKKEKKKRLELFKNKVKHYRKKQEQSHTPHTDPGQDINQTFTPRYLSEYRDISIFGPSTLFPKKSPPTGPFIGSKAIKLSKAEILILSKNPKYSLRYRVDPLDFKMEVEKMNTKRKYEEQFKKVKEEKKFKINGLLTGEIIITEDARDATERRDNCTKKQMRQKEREELLEQLWKEERKRLVYDQVDNKIDFRKRRPTDYKHNKRVKLPSAASTDLEFECERRRREYLHGLELFLVEKDKEKEKEDKHNTGKKKHTTTVERKKHTETRKNEVQNLTEEENKGLKSLNKRVTDGELVITTTDKSSKMAVLTKEQYLQSGHEHTKKDQEITWRDIKYLQTQINSHTWWTSQILNNSKDTDPERMNKNVSEQGYQIPEMFILVKDHKQWTEEEGRPVPSRPVLSGNCCLNTHLSELLSELVEPVSTRLQGAEINSTEEALSKISSLNKHIKSDRNWTSKQISNVLQSIGKFRTGTDIQIDQTQSVSDRDYDENYLGVFTGREEETNCLDETEEETLLDTLDELIITGCEAGNIQGETVETKIISPNCGEEEMIDTTGKRDVEGNNVLKKKIQTRITEFVEHCTNPRSVFSGVELTEQTRIQQIDIMRGQMKKTPVQKNTFNDKVNRDVHCSVLWGRRYDLSNRLKMKKNNGHLMNEKMNKMEGDDNEAIPPLQNMNAKPLLLGADVEALYPNLDKEVTGQIMYKAVMESDISFNGIDYERLSVYLFLTLGAGLMNKCGLGDCIPMRCEHSEARSLGAKSNREMSGWRCKSYNFTQHNKKMMVGRLIQILTIILMSTSCYSFGGNIYRQNRGAGIGERGSACVARTVMSIWDKLWANTQEYAGLMVALFIRYIDDIRFFLHPINNGWKWDGGRWCFHPDNMDDLSDEQRTKRCILETLNTTLDSIKLTIEGEEDFSSGMLPTLDFQTRVREDWEIEFTYFAKPMASGIVIQKDTALPKQTIFSSLRQDLIRRLSNISVHLRREKQKDVIENFIKCLSDSGHSFSFTKSVVLQALTRFKYMVERDSLDEQSEKYKPLYRGKEYDSDTRFKLKTVNSRTWYKNVKLGDHYKQDWKAKLRRKRSTELQVNGMNRKKDHLEPSSVMFVPPTKDSRLLTILEEVESKLVASGEAKWTVKLLEKSGVPLALSFRRKIPITQGCALGEECQVCDGDNVKCSDRGVLYEISCLDCASGTREVNSTETTRVGSNYLSGARQEENLNVSVTRELNSTASTSGEDKLSGTDPEENLKVSGTREVISTARAPDGVSGVNVSAVVLEENLDVSKSGGGEHSDTKVRVVYYGETSRPVRMRALEHFKNLENLKPESVLLEHWMKVHSLQMTPPVFKLKKLKKFKDSLSRQISEAIYIEEGGNLNRKSEFGHNHITRLVGNLSAWDQEQQQTAISQSKDCDRKNINCFIDVIKCVENCLQEFQLDSCCRPPIITKRKRKNTERLVDEKKKKRKMKTSTPSWIYRNTAVIDLDDSPSPVKVAPVSNHSFGSDSSEVEGYSIVDKGGVDILNKSLGLSTQLQMLLVSPRDEDEFTQMKRIVQETINLTRAAIWRGIVLHEGSGVDLIGPIEENALYRQLYWGKMATITDLMDDLDLSDWEGGEVMSEVEVCNLGNNNRKGVLAASCIREVDLEVEYLNRTIIPDGIYVCTVDENKFEVFNIGERTYIMGIGGKGVVRTPGYSPRDIPKMETLGYERKRKKRSPVSPTQSETVLKLRRNDGGCSPMLRPRNKLKKQEKVEKANTGTPVGGSSKSKRRMQTPRRIYNDKMKQLLITSSFSPKQGKDRGNSSTDEKN